MKRGTASGATAKYFVYAIVFEADGGAMMLRGVSQSENHAALLQRHGLTARFDRAHGDFVMGRIRPFPGLNSVVVDVASDLYTAKAALRDPLAVLKADRVDQFERLLASEFPDSHVYVLQGGIDHRVPSLNLKRFEQWKKMRKDDASFNLRKISSLSLPWG